MESDTEATEAPGITPLESSDEILLKCQRKAAWLLGYATGARGEQARCKAWGLADDLRDLRKALESEKAKASK